MASKKEIKLSLKSSPRGPPSSLSFLSHFVSNCQTRSKPHLTHGDSVSELVYTLHHKYLFSEGNLLEGRLTYNPVLFLGVLHEGSFKFISPPSFRCWLQCHLPGLFTGLTFSNANLPSIGQVQISLILYWAISKSLIHRRENTPTYQDKSQCEDFPGSKFLISNQHIDRQSQLMLTLKHDLCFWGRGLWDD